VLLVVGQKRGVTRAQQAHARTVSNLHATGSKMEGVQACGLPPDAEGDGKQVAESGLCMAAGVQRSSRCTRDATYHSAQKVSKHLKSSTGSQRPACVHTSRAYRLRGAPSDRAAEVEERVRERGVRGGEGRCKSRRREQEEDRCPRGAGPAAQAAGPAIYGVAWARRMAKIRARGRSGVGRGRQERPAIAAVAMQRRSRQVGAWASRTGSRNRLQVDRRFTRCRRH